MKNINKKWTDWEKKTALDLLLKWRFGHVPVQEIKDSGLLELRPLLGVECYLSRLRVNSNMQMKHFNKKKTKPVQEPYSLPLVEDTKEKRKTDMIFEVDEILEVLCEGLSTFFTKKFGNLQKDKQDLLEWKQILEEENEHLREKLGSLKSMLG